MPEKEDMEEEKSPQKIDSSSLGETQKEKEIEMSEVQNVVSGGDNSLHIRPTVARTHSDRSTGKEGPKGKKIGHRRVRRDGEVTYKKFETTQLMGSIQLGLGQSIGSMAGMTDRDLLMKDFLPIDTVAFTRDGTLQKTPAHNYSEFRFRTYAPIAFFIFRQIFEIEESEFLASLVSQPMIELSNPGASGSIFYITRDDMFICKTVMHKEADFLRKLLPGYYMNIKQNPRTLLPKFFGLYCYSCNAKNVRMIVMNNLLPSELKMHQKFDLKGSTYKRKASRREREKSSPTFKDLDFKEMYPEGIFLQPDLYDNLMNTMMRDTRVLESYKIMDYSLLIGIHNLNLAEKEESDSQCDGESSHDNGPLGDHDGSRARQVTISSDVQPSSPTTHLPGLERQGSVQYRDRTIAHTTALESITMELEGGSDNEEFEDDDQVDDAIGVKNVWGGIPARNHRGENLLLFIGIIDILQAYGMLKKAEHYWKSLVHDGDTVSVHRPGFYAKRFQDFMRETVFKKMPSTHHGLRASFRKPNHLRRENEAQQDVVQEVVDSSVTDRKDPSVTVITIGEAMNLPSVLQDRKKLTTPSSSNNATSNSLNNQGQTTNHNGRRGSSPAAVQNRFSDITRVDDPASPVPSTGFEDRHDETGSIITMTSDERVQIYVPSPNATPYNTITTNKDQGMFFLTPTLSSQISSSHPTPYRYQPLNPREDATPPPYTHRSVIGESFRSVTPLNQSDRANSSSTRYSSSSSNNFSSHFNNSESTVITDTENVKRFSTEETSLEMVKISINSNSSSTTAIESMKSNSQNQTFVVNSIADKTLAEDLPSLPNDDDTPITEGKSWHSNGNTEGPVSLSDINLVENNC